MVPTKQKLIIMNFNWNTMHQTLDSSLLSPSLLVIPSLTLAYKLASCFLFLFFCLLHQISATPKIQLVLFSQLLKDSSILLKKKSTKASLSPPSDILIFLLSIQLSLSYLPYPLLYLIPVQISLLAPSCPPVNSISSFSFKFFSIHSTRPQELNQCPLKESL